MEYEIIVIGAGPAGYKVALELADAGVKTLLIEKSKERIGGTCLNEGCIPTKNHLEVAKYASKASFFADSGLEIELKGLNLKKLKEKTKSLIKEIRSGVIWLLDRSGVDVIYGEAKFIDSNSIEVKKLLKTLQNQFSSFILLAWALLSVSWGILLVVNIFYIELGTGEFGTLGISISITIFLLVRLIRDHFNSTEKSNQTNSI